MKKIYFTLGATVLFLSMTLSTASYATICVIVPWAGTEILQCF